MEIPKAIADLRQQVHDDLRRQHPEWVLPNGESPMCDAYEARLMDLLALRPCSSYDAQSNGSTSESRSTPQSSSQSKTILARS
jgi:SLT domain-containing protein